MEDKDKRKLTEFAMRCRTSYRDLLRLVADMRNQHECGSHIENLTTAAARVGKALDILNVHLAENGITLEAEK